MTTNVEWQDCNCINKDWDCPTCAEPITAPAGMACKAHDVHGHDPNCAILKNDLDHHDDPARAAAHARWLEQDIAETWEERYEDAGYDSSDPKRFSIG